MEFQSSHQNLIQSGKVCSIKCNQGFSTNRDLNLVRQGRLILCKSAPRHNPLPCLIFSLLRLVAVFVRTFHFQFLKIPTPSFHQIKNSWFMITIFIFLRDPQSCITLDQGGMDSLVGHRWRRFSRFWLGLVVVLQRFPRFWLRPRRMPS